MPNRRDFFTRMAAAAAGMYVVGRDGASAMAPARPVALQAPSARRQVTVAGRRVRVVDVHAHWDMPLGAVVKGTPFEKYASGEGLDARLPIMDQQGIDVAAISVNDFWWYEAKDEGLARAICTAHNETLAKWARAHPDRFVGMASVPLQFPALAAEMLQDATTRLGARGVTIGGHVNGDSVTLPKYDPFWAKAAELGQLVFMHPNGAANIVREGALAGPGGLGNIVGNPLETTVFLSRLIFDGTLDRFPGLRICGAHGGGFLPSYLGRTEVACQRANQTCRNTRRPSEYLKQQILADTMVFSDEGLRHLVAEMGVGQIVYGTDVPFNWPVTVDLVLDASFLSNADKEAILGGTLVRLLRISS
jgi:aminocarboxymuconate-semialdehyde decarboxylase